MSINIVSPARRFIRSLPRAGALIPAVFLVLSGCGGPGEVDIPAAPKGPLAPVTGKVLLPDGSPLKEGTITFMPVKQPGRPATGKLQPDGTYTLTTKDVGEGAVEGDYKVKISSELTAPGPKKSVRYVVDAAYKDEDGSGFKATVKSGSNDFPFKLSATPGGRGSQRERD
jgi:hypothetical protein